MLVFAENIFRGNIVFWVFSFTQKTGRAYGIVFLHDLAKDKSSSTCFVETGEFLLFSTIQHQWIETKIVRPSVFPVYFFDGSTRLFSRSEGIASTFVIYAYNLMALSAFFSYFLSGLIPEITLSRYFSINIQQAG